MPDVCPSPNPVINIHVKLLHEACLRLGGEHRLASHLGVSVERVKKWLSGALPVPDAVFLACLDIVPHEPKPPLPG